MIDQAPVASPVIPAFHALSQLPPRVVLYAIFMVPLFKIELVIPADLDTTSSPVTVVVVRPVTPPEDANAEDTP